MLEHDNGARSTLGTSTVVVRFAATSGSPRKRCLGSRSPEPPLRPHRFVDVLVRFTNAGSDVLRDARLTLTLPPELAPRTRDRRPPGSRRLGVRGHPRRAHARSAALIAAAVATGGSRPSAHAGRLAARQVGISPVEFPSHSKSRRSRNQISPTRSSWRHRRIPSTPANTSTTKSRLRNEGDGPADRLLVRIIPDEPGGLRAVEYDDQRSGAAPTMPAPSIALVGSRFGARRRKPGRRTAHPLGSERYRAASRRNVGGRRAPCWSGAGAKSVRSPRRRCASKRNQRWANRRSERRFP